MWLILFWPYPEALSIDKMALCNTCVISIFHGFSPAICGFDGYTSTRGQHEGIDIKWYTGSPIYLHANPIGGLYTGKKITKGQQLGMEGTEEYSPHAVCICLFSGSSFLCNSDSLGNILRLIICQRMLLSGYPEELFAGKTIH